MLERYQNLITNVIMKEGRLLNVTEFLHKMNEFIDELGHLREIERGDLMAASVSVTS